MTTKGSSSGHFAAVTDFPVYAVAFASENELIVAGGGGPSKSGIKNSISIYNLNTTQQQVERAQELELSRSEDAPSTIAVHPKRKELFAGINSEARLVKEGTNENLRLFSYSDGPITHVRSKKTLLTKDPEVYQKITTFSKDGTKLAVGSSASQLTVLSLPELENILPHLDFADDELFDADFSEDGSLVLGASSERICVWRLPETPSASADPPEPLQVIERPVLKSSLRCTFRAARFGRGDTAARLFTVVNAHPASSAQSAGRKRNSKGVERRAFVSVWDAKTWAVTTTRTVSRKPVTSFDVSPNGKLLAVGSADMSVGIFSADGVRFLVNVLSAHNFPSTTLRFSPSSQLLVSGSADSTIRVILADKALHPDRNSNAKTFVAAFIVILITVLIRLYGSQHVHLALEAARRHLHV